MPVEVRRIIKRILDASYEAYLVGGYPRDYYRGFVSDDYDICTNATPEELKKLFPHLEEIRFGSCRLKEGTFEVEITTYREEYEYQAHRFIKNYRYVDTLRQDLMRRDFVMNTLCMDINGNYIDLLNAREDIDKRMIRTVGDPFQRLEEDALRILRAVRFATTLHFDIDPSLKEAIIEKRDLLKELSKNRIKMELDRILQDPSGLEWLCKLKLEEALELGEFSNVTWVDDIDFCWAQLNWKAYPMSRKKTSKISAIQKLLYQNLSDPLVLYQTEDEWLRKLAMIKNISYEELSRKKELLPIHGTKEIAVSIDGLKQTYATYSDKLIYQWWKELEIQIVLGTVENTKDAIHRFIDQKISIHQK